MRVLPTVALVLTLLGAACGDDDKSPAAPTPTCQDRTASNYGGALPCTYPPACETNHTGTVTFRNAGSRTVDIVFNGAKVEVLTPGETSAPRTVTAGGAQYLVEVIITNTTIRPCGSLLLTPIQCQNTPYATCSF